MSLKEQVMIRTWTKNDEPFIFSAWLKGTRRRHISRGMDNAIFYKRFTALITAVLARSSVDIVCLKEDPDIILGFIVYRDNGPVPIISYWYVKSGYRGQGLGQMLIKKLVGDVSVATNFATDLGGYFEKHNIVYDPFYDFEVKG